MDEWKLARDVPIFGAAMSSFSIIRIIIEGIFPMMKLPVHPGELLREDVVVALGRSVKEAAEMLGLSGVALSRVLNGHAGGSPDLALRLERAGASTAWAWLAMQMNHDLAQAMKREQPPVRPLDDGAA